MLPSELLIGGRPGGTVQYTYAMPPHRCRHPCSSGHGLAVTMGPGKSHPPLSKGSTRHMEKEMLLLSSSRSCLGTRCFLQMSILPRGFSRFPASIAVALLQLDWRFTTLSSDQRYGCRTVQCIFDPSSLSIRPNRTPGTSGFGLERAQKQREAAAWPPTAPAPTLGQPWFVFAIIITIFLSRLQGRQALSLRMSCRLRWFASQAIKTLLTDTVTV
jgi:hypothetical protein